VLTRTIKQAGLSLVVVLIVALLTLLFSFLGTITCAAVVGMMMAAMRQPKLQALLVSLMFPVVSYAFSSLSGAGLPIEKRLLLALLCLSVFAVTYLLTCGMLLLERQEAPCPESEACGSGNVSRENPWDDPMQRDLQGKWKGSLRSVSGETVAQVLEFKGKSFSLTLFENDGSTRTVGEGWFEVHELDPYRIATFQVRKCDQSAAGSHTLSQRWLFRVRNDVLTVGRGFDDTTSVAEPSLERYTRIGA
jgi:hypothetical protein